MSQLNLLSLICFLTITQSNAQFALNGSAIALNDTCYQLTPEEDWQVGSIWNEEKVNLNASFEVEVNLLFGCKDEDGADGIVFGLQPISTSIGVAGGDLGIGGINPSLVVEFDVFENIDFGDPTFDHIAIFQNGNVRHNQPRDVLAAPVQASLDQSNIEDCEYHRARISWDVENQELSVYFDCELRLTYTGDIVNEIFDGSPEVFWGFTSATGGLNNIHEVCFSQITFLDGLEDIAVCRGNSVQLEASGGVAYRWTPAIGLSDPNIANPIATPNITTRYEVEITDDCGITFTDDLWVELKDEQSGLFTIPNVFSPNGDNLNDSFGLIVEDDEAEIQNYNCKVLNRWGQLIFETSNPSVSWNGLYNGKESMVDVYIYIMQFELDNCSISETGDVTLVR